MMDKDKPIDLFNKSDSIEFYNDRYTTGYMVDWPLKKKQRIIEIIKSLNLPETGNALDYGCGNGVFTAVIKSVLPAWNVFGSEISQVAVDNASERFPNCHFFNSEDPEFTNMKFDFIFSHHVFEHVYNIHETAREINEKAKQDVTMLHVLPCGNAGSLEYEICNMVTDGINIKMENRFFFEEEGHLRRLTSDELTEIFGKFLFKYKTGFFANQYFGALDWISDWDDDFIIKLTDEKRAINKEGEKKLIRLRKKIRRIKFIKNHALFYIKNGIPESKGFVRLKHMLKSNIFCRLYAPFHDKVVKEWKEKSLQKNGSEMYIVLERK